MRAALSSTTATGAPRAAHDGTGQRLLRLGWPIFVGQLAVMLHGAIDLAMAGRLSAADLAAVGIGASIQITVVVTLMGVVFALTPVAAQHFGAGRAAEVAEDVRQTLWLALLLGAAGWFALRHPGPALELAQVAPAVEAKVRAYLGAAAWGLPGALAYRAFYAFSSAVSRPGHVMAINLAGLAAKVPLNLLFLSGAFGAQAAGSAGFGHSTAIVWTLSCAAGCWLMARSPQFAEFAVLRRWSWPRPARLAQLLRLGVPIGVAFFVEITAFTVIALFVARFGVLASAAHQIAASLAFLAFIVPLSLGSAAGVLVGQALGAGDPALAQRRARVATSAGLAAAALLGAAVFGAREAIAAAYTPDPAVAAAAAAVLAVVAPYCVCDAVQTVLMHIARAYKKTTVPMLLVVLALWLTGLGGGWLLAFHAGDAALPPAPPQLRGVAAFWWAASAGVLLAAVLGAAYVRRVVRSALPVSATPPPHP